MTLAIFSVDAGFYRDLSSESFSDPSGDYRPLNGASEKCDTCTPTPCDARCYVLDWLEHVQCHKHLMQSRVFQLSCDDLIFCHSCRSQLALDTTGSFQRRVYLLRKDRDAKHRRRKAKRFASVAALRPHSAYESDLCEFTVQCCPLDAS